MSCQLKTELWRSLESLQRGNSTVQNDNSSRICDYCRTLLSPTSQRSCYKEMPQSAPPAEELGPKPWPVPPPRVDPLLRNRSEVYEDLKAEQESLKRGLDLTGALSDNRHIDAKVARAIFQKISELYPDNVENVLKVEQMPSVRTTVDSGKEGNHGEQRIEQDVQLGSSVVQVVGLFSDEAKCQYVDAETKGKTEEESIEKRLSGQVDLGPSLNELFSEGGELNSLKDSLREEANAEEEILSFSFGGEKSHGSNPLVIEALKKLGKPSSEVNETFPSNSIFQRDTDDMDEDLELIISNEEPPDFVDPIAHRVLSSELLGRSKRRIESTEEVSSYSQETEPSNSELQTKGKTTLRRPIASRRRGVVNIPKLNKQLLTAPEESRSSSTPNTPQTSTRSRSSLSKSSTASKLARIGGTPKGVIIRTLSQHRKMAGNRRAETGLIMSREELRSARNRDIAKNPVPKSLRPWELLFSDDDAADNVPTLTPASMNVTAKGESAAVSGTKEGEQEEQEGGSRMRSTERRSLFSLSSIKWSPRSGKEHHGSEDVGNSSRFSEVVESSGMVGRLSSGFRRATQVFGRKPGGEAVDLKSDIVIAGTLDEAVCRISVACRKKFGYAVYVRDGGRRIRVESGEGCDWEEYLRATLTVREIKGNDVMCAIVIRPSRKDGMKTSTATLAEFYQRLEQELRGGESGKA